MSKHHYNKRFDRLPISIWQKIIHIDELKGRWAAGSQLNPQVLGRLKRSVLVTSTGASTRIEGSSLSDEDIERMLRGLDIQNFSDRDKQEVQGYYELLTNIFESWPTLRITEGLIQFFHRELLQYVDKDERHRGSYKQKENKVHMVDSSGTSLGVLFNTTPAYLTGKEMLELVTWLNDETEKSELHPLLLIGNFIVQFLQIHPFEDGNGRISRILTNLLLLQAGYGFIPYISHEKLIEDNKPDYYLALRRSQNSFGTEHETIEPWLNFFLKIVHAQATKANELVLTDTAEYLLSPSQLKVWEFMQTEQEVTPKQLTDSLGIPRPTISQVLNRLLQLGLVERLGQGRGTRYRRKS